LALRMKPNKDCPLWGFFEKTQSYSVLVIVIIFFLNKEYLFYWEK
jgi:hypothetical protein